MAQERFCVSAPKAGRFIMYVDFIGVGFSIPLGYAIDKIGKRRYFIMFSAFFFVLSHLTFLVLPQCFDNE